VTAALEVRGLSAGYGPMRVLHGIDLALAPGERVGLLGLNGHGKTTLMRAVVGLVGWRRGDVRVRGRSVVGVPTFRLAREGVVMIPQGDALFPGLTVRENLDSGAYARGSWRARRVRRELVLDLFPRLAERLGQPVGTLSGGERRMVSVGRGLMTEAHVYLVDEPSLGLAPGLAAGLVETLLSADLRGGAMLIAEQNRALIAEGVDRSLTMHGGQLTERAAEV
jgi:branched-chain amino acid transport system ATP-binding protein